MRKLSFMDHHRMSYHDTTWRPEFPAHVGEFYVGDYVGDGGVDVRGEMKLSLYSFDHHQRHIVNEQGFTVPAPPVLSVQINCFIDGFGTLRALERMGVLRKLQRTELHSRDDLSRLLIECGLRDRSDQPMETEVAA